jgi:tRNA 2-selenouridine synthase
MVQPSQEQFENLFAIELQKMDFSKSIWLEDESVTIGKRVIPKPIWDQMRNAKVIKVEIPKEERIDFLNKEYGSLNKDFLKSAVLGIAKRLGPLETKLTLQAIDEDRMKDFINQVLVYYDKAYMKGIKTRLEESVTIISLDTISAQQNAKLILDFVHHNIIKNKNG